MSVDYVIRLEQGRGLRPSPEVLDALAGALRLSDDERAYLFDLTRHWSAGRRTSGDDAGWLSSLVGALSPLPASWWSITASTSSRGTRRWPG